MTKEAVELLVDYTIEIIPPDREEGGTHVCLCCRKHCSSHSIDDDGCGICNECLAA